MNTLLSFINNKIRMRILFLILTGLLLIGAPVQQAFAQQQYPVQIQPTVSFPSTFLNDYADPENTNIRVYLADLTKVNYKINIRIKLEGSGNNVVYENKTGITLTLDGGDVYFLNDQDLKKLFAITDLATNVGSQTNSANVLPEGVYTMSLQAYDASVLPVQIPVSNGRTDFTIFNVVRYDPPMLNAPNNAEAFDMQTINQNIFFTWTPRHVVFSPKQQVKYRFSLIKVIPVDRNPYDAMKAMVPTSTGNLVVSDLDFPTFIYSPADLPLEEGCVYAWQVQAYEEVNGIEKAVSRFKNSGYSEVYTFSIKENCEPVTINPISVSGNQVTLSWYGSTISTYSEYEVNYRPAMTSQPWIPILTSQTSITLDNTVLQSDLTYEYTVKARCKNWQSPVYGGTFKIEPATCMAPRPITVDTKSGSPVLTWIENAGVDSIRLYYREKSSAAPFTRVLIAGGTQTYTLPPLAQDGYIVELDALCGTETAAGIKDTFNYNDNGMIGPCPIPMPFQFSAQRVAGDTAMLGWQQVPENTGYSITYWHKDSAAVTHTINNLLTPSTKANLLFDNQLYAYKVTFMCGTKSTTTPVGMFRIDGTINSIPLDPKTADCFPPVELQGQARSTTSAFVEWDKIDGADEYQLFYGVKGTKPFKPFTTTATSTTLKNLEDSKQYQFVVRVRCGGLYSIFSDTALVDLGQDINSKDCDTVAFMAAIKKTTSNILLAWKYDANYTGYVITYRESAQPPSSVYTQAFTNIDTLVQNHLYGDSVKYTFQNLKAGTEYLFTIQAICGAGKAFINAPLKVSTLPDAKSAGTCGSVNACDKTDKTPLTTLNVGEKFHCADYEITVDEVENPSSPTGTYTGNGHMNMPIAGLGDFVTMSISFSNIKINTDTNRCVVEGMINIDSMNAGLLPTDLRNQISGYMDQVTDAIDQANNLLTQASDGLQQAQDAVQQATDYFQGGENTGGVVTGELGETKVTGTVPTSTTSATVSGKSVTLPPCPAVTVASFPALLKDDAGNVFQVTSTGAVVHVGTYDTTYAATPITVNTGTQQVVFEENTTARYDFDMWKPEYKNVLQIEREYEKISSDYYVPAKCITPGEMDVVNAKLSGTGADPGKVVFANGKGLLYKFTKSGSTFTIKLAGGPAADAQEIYAWYVDGATKTAIGKLLVPSYARQTKNVVIIPVDLKRGTRQDINTALFKEYLDKTYGRLGITYNVTVDDDFRGNTSWDADGNNSVQVTGSSLLSNDYQGEEEAMINAYVALKGAANLDSNTAYFLAPYEVSQIESNLLGKMPAEEQFGFLYTGAATPAGIARTIAHELGHGAYHLEHIFNTAYLGPGKNDAIKNGSLNLMSYFNDPKAIELWKFQWDIVNAPGHVWGILHKDKNTHQVIVQDIKSLVPYLNDNKTSYTFISSAGKQISLPSDIKSVTFESNDRAREYIKMKVYAYADGGLSEFVLNDGTKYVGKYYVSSGIFAGYYTEDNKPYTDIITKTLTAADKSKAIVGYLCVQQGTLKFNVSRLKYDGPAITTDNLGDGKFAKTLPVSALLPPADPVKIYLNFTSTTPYTGIALEFLSKNSTCDAVFPKYVLAIATLADMNQELVRDCWGMVNFLNQFVINVACTTCVNKPGTLTEADYKKKVDDLIVELNSLSSVKTLLANTNASAEDLRNAFAKVGECVFGQFTVKERINAIKILTKEELYDCQGLIYNQIDAFNNCAEEYVKNIVLKTPPDQVVDFLTELDGEMLSLLFDTESSSIGLNTSGLNGDEAADVVYTLTNWMIQKNFNKGFIDDQYDHKYSYSMYNYMGASDMNNTFGGAWTYMPNSTWIDGKIKFIIADKQGVIVNPDDITYTVSWDDWVLVRALEDLNYGGLVLEKGGVISVPAIYLFYEIQNAKAKFVGSTIRERFDVIMLVSGGGAIVNGASKFYKVLAIADMAISSADLTISNTQEEIVAWLGPEDGPQFLEAWNQIVAFYGVATTVRAISPYLYSKSLLIHNKLQQIEWSNIPPNIKPATVAALKKYKVKLEAIFGTSLVRDVVSGDIFSSIKSSTGNATLLKTNILDNGMKELVYDVIENGAYNGGSSPGFFGTANDIFYSPKPQPTVPSTGFNGLQQADVITLNQKGVQLTKSFATQNGLSVSRVDEYALVDDLTNASAIQLNNVGSLPKASLYKVTSPTLGVALYVEPSVSTSTQIAPRLIYASKPFVESLLAKDQVDKCACKTRTPTVCIALDNLKTRTNDAVGVGVLCKATGITDGVLQTIIAKLNTYTVATVQVFLNDLKGVGTDPYLCAHVNQLTVPLVEAWKIVYDARGANAYKKDFVLLQQIVEMRSTANAEMYRNLGGDNVLIEVIKRNVGAPCNTCTGNKVWMNNMDEYLKDVVYFVETYKATNANTDGVQYVFSSGITSASEGQAYGAVYMLKVLRKNTSIHPTEFEAAIDPSGTLKGCHPDAKIDDQILEFKSWSPNDADTDVGSMGPDDDEGPLGKSYFKKFSENGYTPGKSSSYTQFLCYLNRISSMNQLSYYFDKDLIVAKGQTDADQYVKGIFQKLFTNTNTQSEIFGVIWNNQNLRADLFPGIDFTDPDAEDTCLGLFNTKIANTGNSFYDFIKVK